MRVTIMRAQRSHARRTSWCADTALSITRPLDFGEHCQRGEPDPLRPFPALIFFAVAAALGWIGNRFWPEDWMYNPLL